MANKIYALTGSLILLMGCATSGTVQPVEAKSVEDEKVEVGTHERRGCTAVEEFTLARESRNNLLRKIKNEAIKRGANFIKVTKMRMGNITGKATVHGIAMICPAVKERASSDTSLMPMLDVASIRAVAKPTRTAEIQPSSSMSTSLIEGDDGNPFE